MDAQTHIKQRQRVKQRQRERARAGRRSVLIALESSPTGCTHLWNDTRFSKDILWNQKVRGKPVYLRVDDRNPLKSKHIARSFRRSVHSVGTRQATQSQRSRAPALHDGMESQAGTSGSCPASPRTQTQTLAVEAW